MRIFLFVLAFFSWAPAFAQTPLPAEKRRFLDSITTQDVPAKAPGIATAIIEDGELVYEKYAGYADFADSSLITKKTRFNIASNGKQFTALAVLSLVDAGKIRLADDIYTFIFETGSTGIATFYLNGDRVRGVTFTRQDSIMLQGK